MPASYASPARGRVVVEIPHLDLARRMCIDLNRFPVLERISIETLIHGDTVRAKHHVDALEKVRGDVTDIQIGTLVMCGGKFEIGSAHSVDIDTVMTGKDVPGGSLIDGMLITLKSPDQLRQDPPLSPKAKKWAVELIDSPFRSRG